MSADRLALAAMALAVLGALAVVRDGFWSDVAGTAAVAVLVWLGVLPPRAAAPKSPQTTLDRPG